MLHENVGWDFCHHVAEQAAAYAGDGSHKHQKEGVVCKALTDSGVDAHYGKNTKSHRVHHQHHLVIGYIPLQQLPLEIKKEKHQHRCEHCHSRIDRLLEHTWRDDSKGYVTDHSSANSGNHSQHRHPENVHLLL